MIYELKWTLVKFGTWWVKDNPWNFVDGITLSIPSLGLESTFLAFLRGECEIALEDFLDRVCNGLPYKETDNFAYVEGDKVITNELKPLVNDLDTLPLPDKDIYPYFENSIYAFSKFFNAIYSVPIACSSSGFFIWCVL